MNGGSDEYWPMIRSCAGGAQDKSVINRIMLRFRPIAPKPAAGSDDVSDGLTSGDNKNLILSKGRRKRKYVRVRRNSGYTRKKPTTTTTEKPTTTTSLSREIIEKDSDNIMTDDDSAATLQLLPEKIDLNRSNDGDLRSGTVEKNSCLQENRGLPMWSSCKEPEVISYEVGKYRVTDRVVLVHCWLTVDCVTGACMVEGGQGFGSTDLQRMRNLERDTCPGFISDGLNSVVWVNGAFRRMVMAVRQQNEEEKNDGLSPEIVVGLVIKESFPSYYSAFTGHVKLQYTMGKEYYSTIVPCDLWRMDGGGFAWRLDVEAALTLGR